MGVEMLLNVRVMFVKLEAVTFLKSSQRTSGQMPHCTQSVSDWMKHFLERSKYGTALIPFPLRVRGGVAES